jgi:hypothetical protein
LASSFAAAACPDATDLAKGIEFRTSGGDVEVHRKLRPDWITISVIFPDGDGSVLEMYHGMYMLSAIPIEGGVPKPGQREDYADVSELTQWPRPTPDTSWTNTTPSGGIAVSGALETKMIAGCRYDSVQVDVQFADDPTYTETYAYLPELGLGLLVKTVASDGTDTYSYISVKASE